MKNVEFKEQRQHGIKEFPIEVYHSAGFMAPYHWHDEYEFLYLNAGSAYCRIDADLLELNQGECAFIKGGVLHSLFVEDKADFEFYAVVFHPALIFNEIDVCNKYISPEYAIKNKFSPVYDSERSVIEIIKLLMDVYEGKSFAYEIRIKSLLFDIFSIIFENGLFEIDMDTKNKKDTKNLKKVISYIHSNYRSHISVYDLAEECGYSVSHFTRFFKEITGKSPIEYINRYKIYLACGMLKSADISVLDVALECGFENVGYFIRTFKKYTGYTPYQFKNT